MCCAYELGVGVHTQWDCVCGVWCFVAGVLWCSGSVIGGGVWCGVL